MHQHLARLVRLAARLLFLALLCLSLIGNNVSIALAAISTSPSQPRMDSMAPMAPPPYWGALPNGGLNGAVLSIAVSGADVYVGGDFTQTADGAVTNLNHIALLRAGQWYPLSNNGLDLSVRTIAISGTAIYVGGDFTQTADNTVTTLGHIARYSGGTSGTWSPLEDNGLNGTVNAIAISGTQLYVGGNFSQSANGLVTNLNHVASYNGSAWSALAHGGLNGSSVNAIAMIGTDAYVGGAFTQSFDGAVANLNAVAKYSGGAWTALANNGLNLPVNALAVSGTDLYVGGTFRYLADSTIQNYDRIALYSGGVWNSLSGTGLNSDVNALAVIGGDVYVGGNFTGTSDGTTPGLNYLARYTGGAWFASPNNGLDSFVQALAISGNAITYEVYAGGQFIKSGDSTNLGLSHVASLQNTLSTNPDLNNLVLSDGVLTPTFASGTLSYTATVTNSVASVTVTPSAANLNSNIKVNGTAVASGSASAPIALIVGTNPITTVVTAQDGITVKTYTVTVTRAKSANADLSGMVLSQGALTPAFASGTTAYTATVAQSVTSITVTPTVSDTTASVTVNGAPVTSGTPSGAIALGIGANLITVAVTAQDGTTTKSYTVTVTRSNLSGDANLSNLSLSSGTLTPAFSSNTTSYSATVANGVTSITVTPTLSDTNASVTVNGTPVTSGSPSSAIPLVAGANVITTTVTAHDGVTLKDYIVTVTRTPSNNADLIDLVLSDGTLTPAFASNVTAYTATVANNVAMISVTPTLSDTNASVMVNGFAVTSGLPSSAIFLNVGANLITTTVTAQDGATIKNYVVTVTRAASSVADLVNLILSNGTLTPGFSIGTTNYTATVANNVTSISVTPVALDTNSTITVNGSPVVSGNPSSAIPLIVGDTIITTTVTAQDGVTTKSYIVTVTRSLSNNADLNNLVLSSGTLTPAFNSNTTSYTASVANSVTSITVTPTLSDTNASVTVNGSPVTSGTPSGAILLGVGANLITTAVTAQDGVTIKTYTVTVTRAAPSSNADLSNLVLSNGTLSPSFSSATTAYSATVANSIASITLTPTAADAASTIKVNGVTVASGSPSSAIPLVVGANLITTTVTAQNGTTTKNYVVTVTRSAQSGNADLSSLVLSKGTLTPAFAANTTAYTASVAITVTSIVITPTVAGAGATVKVNGTTVASGTPSSAIALSTGTNTITTIVTAQDGVTTKTYIVQVGRGSLGFKLYLPLIKR
ncbi:MAG: cadherin-like beta sandwich domain-containing protein [Chloroflexi bacterium]|nr:cadherin-like beta sandwich domain-containing protein [Chloroflexota bacterium]